VIFTGLLVIIDNLATHISCEKGSLLPPKPPPDGVAITRMRLAGSFNTLAMARCR